jgi:hypothetical protein
MQQHNISRVSAVHGSQGSWVNHCLPGWLATAAAAGLVKHHHIEDSLTWLLAMHFCTSEPASAITPFGQSLALPGAVLMAALIKSPHLSPA